MGHSFSALYRLCKAKAFDTEMVPLFPKDWTLPKILGISEDPKVHYGLELRTITLADAESITSHNSHAGGRTKRVRMLDVSQLEISVPEELHQHGVDGFCHGECDSRRYCAGTKCGIHDK
jgi:hypothetical protein